MTGYRTTSGQVVRQGKLLGRGGEGSVYDVEGQPSIVLKVYTDGKAEQRREKLLVMVAGGYRHLSSFVAFPIDVVFDAGGKCVGFTMSKAAGFKEMHELFLISSRKSEFPGKDFRFVLRTALNTARAFASVHRTGCVIGDVNQRGVMVGSDATVSVIDSDSFQVRSGSKVYRSIVGTEDYTPPELQGISLAAVDRDPAHDAFGLAVLIFQMLMLGRHPFAGTWQGTGGPRTISDNIKAGRFPYSSIGDRCLIPPPRMVPLSILPQATGRLFERAFTAAGSSGRPTAAEWVGELERLEQALTKCSASDAHVYPDQASSCPWCKFDRENGADVFPSNTVSDTLGRESFDVEAIMREFLAIPQPGPPPDPATLVAVPQQTSPSKAAAAVLVARRNRRMGAIVLAVGSLLLIVAGFPLAVVGLGAAWWWAASEGDEAAKLKSDAWAAERHWRDEAERWTRGLRGSDLAQRSSDFRQQVDEYRRLPETLKGKLAKLEQEKRSQQLKKYLAAFLIDRATIPRIGDGRKAMLASYGIETAWDIEKYAVMRVPGFGEALANELLAWRRKKADGFTFNPAAAVDPAAIRAVTDEVSRRRVWLEASLRSGLQNIRQSASDAASSRRAVPSQLSEAYQAWKQAEADVRAVS